MEVWELRISILIPMRIGRLTGIAHPI